MGKLFKSVSLTGLIALLAACGGGSRPEADAGTGDLDFSPPAVATEVFTRSTGPDLDPATLEQLRSAEKVNHTFSNGYRVSFWLDEGLLLTGGDIVVGEAEALPSILSRYEAAVAQGASMSVAAQGVGLLPGSSRLWPGKRVPYVVSGFTPQEASVVRRAISLWNATDVVVKFVPAEVFASGGVYKSGRPFAHFRKSGKACGYSWVGEVNRFREGAYQGQTIGLRCVNVATIHHEMGHAVGLWHEQQRCDRDRFVTVNTGDEVNYGKRCFNDGYTRYGPYNFDSVMHYRPNSVLQVRRPLPPGGWTGNSYKVGQAASLSTGDIVAISQMYR